MGSCGLLSFTDALKDSPAFRSSLRKHQQDIQVLEDKAKNLIRLCSCLIDQGKLYLQSFGSLISGMEEMNSQCFNPDDPAFKSFGSLVSMFHEILKFKRVLIEQAYWTITKNLSDFLKHEVSKAYDHKGHFEKVSASLDEAFVKNAQVAKNKPHEAAEARNELTAVGTCFAHTALDYVYQINVIEARKSYEMLESIYSFVRACQTYFHQGQNLFTDWETGDNKVLDCINELKGNARRAERKMQDRHVLVPKEIFQHPTGMPQDPDVVMEGYLFKKGSKGFRNFKRRWFIVQENQLLYCKRNHHQREVASSDHSTSHDFGDYHYSVVADDLKLCLVRQAPPQIDRQNCFELVMPHKNYLLQADSEQLCTAWIKALQRSIEAALHDAIIPTPRLSEDLDTDNSSFGGTPRTVAQEILSVPGNEKCADCDKSNPQWASINIGVTVCISCCGVHRSLNVQVSKPRSLTLDAWEPEHVKLLKLLGNKIINEIYLRNWDESSVPLKAKPDSNVAVRQAWITAKYVEKRFCGKKQEPMSKRNSRLSSVLSTGRVLRPKSVSTDVEHSCGDSNRMQPLPKVTSSVSLTDITATLGAATIASIVPVLALKYNQQYSSDTAIPGLKCERSEDATISRCENEALYLAAGEGNLAKMAKAIGNGASVNAQLTKYEDRAPLFQCISNGSLECSEYLLLNGGKVTLQDSAGNTPLHIASIYGRTGQLCQLIKRGANLDIINLHGKTALDIAVDDGRADIVTLLRLAKLNESNRNDKWSPVNCDDGTLEQAMQDLSLQASSQKPRAPHV